MKQPTGSAPSQVPPLAFLLSFSFQFTFNLNSELKVINDDDGDDFDDDDERKNSKEAKFLSNDRSGHDDQFCPKIVKIGAILAIFRPFEDLQFLH